MAECLVPALQAACLNRIELYFFFMAQRNCRMDLKRFRIEIGCDDHENVASLRNLNDLANDNPSSAVLVSRKDDQN